MALGEVGQRLGHLGQNLHGMLGDGVGKAADGLVQRGRQRLNRQPLETSHQRQREAMHAIAVSANVFALHVVQHLAHLVGRVLMMIEERNEVGDRPLEVNIVLPERVVGVDQ